LNSSQLNKKIPQSLKDFINDLLEVKKSTYNHIIHSVKFEANAFEDYSSWSKDCYTRNCILDTEEFELILICWNQGQQTQIHDHGGEECWVKIIEGELKETIYKQNEVGEVHLVKTTVSKKNEITYMKDFMGFHRLENESKKRSISLHLYAKPIRTCRMFDEESKIFVDKNLTYHTNTGVTTK
jgi:cysteine dioxygenase